MPQHLAVLVAPTLTVNLPVPVGHWHGLGRQGLGPVDSELGPRAELAPLPVDSELGPRAELAPLGLVSE
jgi:hypothetical protein